MREMPQGLKQAVERQGVDAAVDFRNDPLIGRGVSLLDDSLDLPSRAAHDPAISVRIRHSCGQHGGRRARSVMRLDETLQRGGREQRHVRIQKQYGASLSRKDGLHLQKGVARAQLRKLCHELQGRIRREGGLDFSGGMADDNRRGPRRQGRHGMEYVLNQTATRKAMQHLRLGRLHARTLSRGKNDDVKIAHK